MLYGDRMGIGKNLCKFFGKLFVFSIIKIIAIKKAQNFNNWAFISMLDNNLLLIIDKLTLVHTIFLRN